MTLLDRVRRARRRLALVVGVSALIRATCVALLLIAVARILQLAARPIAPPAGAALAASAVAAFVVAGVVLWRGRGVRTMQGVALWVEEREPDLAYALVTAVEQRQDASLDLVIAAERAHIETHVSSAARRSLGRAAAMLLLLMPALLATASPKLLRHADVSRARGGHAEPGNRLDGYTAHVTPPPYARRSATRLREPTEIAALVGSGIVVEGGGAPEGMVAAIDSAARPVEKGERGWRLGITMPDTPRVVTLRDRGYRTLMALMPVRDSAPAVTLREPARDTTYRIIPRGDIAIDAVLTDDIGLSHGFVEYTISSGAEESFDTKQVIGRRVAFANARSGTVHERFALDTMNLTPGSVVNVRVIGVDYNDVSGPGVGSSDTRTLRIAEPLDSTSIVAAPPAEIDKMWVSQRLLNLRTDTLIGRKRRIPREAFVNTSSSYGNTQDEIRQRTLGVIDLLEDNGVGGTEKTDISIKLRAAADLMWTAREQLGIALPDTARPVMTRVLAILDTIRLMNRYHLRGKLAPVPVDIERVRLSGRDNASADARSPRDMLRDQRAALARRLDAATQLAHGSPDAAADSLFFIRIATSSIAPEITPHVVSAIDALRRGRSADIALARARRALTPAAVLLTGPMEWGGVLP